MYIRPSLGVPPPPPPTLNCSIMHNMFRNFKSKTQIFEGLTDNSAHWDNIRMVSRDHHHAIIQLPNPYAFKLISKRLVEIKGMSYTQTTSGLQNRNFLP